jgi:hypothetical protein
LIIGTNVSLRGVSGQGRNQLRGPGRSDMTVIVTCQRSLVILGSEWSYFRADQCVMGVIFGFGGSKYLRRCGIVPYSHSIASEI